MTSWTGTDFASEVEGNQVPVLSLLGELDPGASAERTQATIGTQYKTSVVSVMPKTGHYPMYESPKEFVEIVSIFLSQF